MEVATKRGSAINRTDLRALVNGQYSGDSNALIDLLAADLLEEVTDRLHDEISDADSDVLVGKPARKVIADRLAELLMRDVSTCTTARHRSLPTSKLSPEEVISQTGMSKTTLYRADHTKFYSVVPAGMKNGRAYPAWQFFGDVPSHLPRVLAILSRKSRIQVNTFFVSEQSALNELSPAEVLAGLPFEDRGMIEPAQSRILSMSDEARLNKVIALAQMEVASHQ
ncbi:hypothetical protein AWB67_06803 [Caballeronia terrestris]|uniref:Uncharacterized protein n=1 Tax=Caballeronia terrestris TaxID=1226301 RepID=A0A158KUR4_9BURK|nr:hypothetical protein [Caballeronia terrestris]SAL84916.1 hypothetical protein AWB67_06803 [Caballeronia terrestris]